MVAVLLLCACATVREPAPSMCASGVCIVQGSRRDISKVCRLLHGKAAANCWDPYTQTAWISDMGELSEDICYAADSRATCVKELFR